MLSMNRSWSWPALALVTLVPLAARAQMGPGTLPPGQTPGGTIGEEEPKKEGVAEKAPKEAAPLPTLPPLPPYPGQDKKKFELVTFDGYMRLRANWLSNYNLGYHDIGQGIPFPQPLTCRDTTSTNISASKSCPGSFGTSNMRVRIEPTFHLSESVALHLQIDLLDNIVLGSTQDGVYLDGTTKAPWASPGITTSNQVAPEAGKNSPWSSIRVKQAWGEVKTALGTLEFGRMPSHWGLGILANSGGYDWIHGTTCTDCDYGDNVDRVMFGTTIPGTPLRAALAFDWAASGPTSGQVDAWKARQDGQPYDLGDQDDVTQWTAMVTHIDDPDEWNGALREGKALFNYGAYFVYRSQDFEAPAVAFGSSSPEKNYLSRHATMYIPDLWARLTVDKFVLEAELVGQFGSVDNLAANVDPTMKVDPTVKPQQDFRQLGGVMRMNYYALNEDLELGVEVGSASGDQWENEASPGTINIHQTSYYPVYPDSASYTTITNFRFNLDYRPDLIFFRELLGAVTNATYVKPAVRYNLSDRFSFKAAALIDIANVPVATPGNSALYGIELDGDLGYSNVKEGFFAGLSYGVFFPLMAMDHPVALFPTETTTGASTAQTLQGRFVLKF
jgi:uncharacterized protein (TIGR04551 family)